MFDIIFVIVMLMGNNSQIFNNITNSIVNVERAIPEKRK